MVVTESKWRCSFCGQLHTEVNKLVAGPDEELLQRIPFIAKSATNIEAGLRVRVRELRERGVSWARIGVALGMTRQSAWEWFSRATT